MTRLRDRNWLALDQRHERTLEGEGTLTARWRLTLAPVTLRVVLVSLLAQVAT